MIHAFNFTCHRDRYLSELMETTLYKYAPLGTTLKVVNTDTDHKYARYGNGSGWEAGMMKVAYMKTMSFADDDWVLSIDSDVVFGNGNVFELLCPHYSIIGIQGQQPWNTFFGKWAHMSGCLIFIRGDIARKIAAWPNDTFDEIRMNHFKPYHITENEDVMLSLFANLWDDSSFDIGSVPGIASNNFEDDMVLKYGSGKHKMASFYHLNYCPTQFMGFPVTGKWDIPGVLKKLTITI